MRNPRDPRHRRSRGFSMVEFLVAAFIMAIGLLGLTVLQTMAVSQAANGRGRATAVYVANWILQRAQAEGQASYWAKLNTQTLPYTAFFTANSSTLIDRSTFGGFNVDGVQVTTANGTPIFTSTSTGPNVPPPEKRFPVYTASWGRRAYGGSTPAAAGAQAQEFVVNVTWTEGNAVQKHLSMSRIIRY